MLIRTLLLGAVIFLLAAEDPNPPNDSKKELALLQGEWTMVSLEQLGKKSPAGATMGLRLSIEGDQWKVSSGAGSALVATLKIDPTQTPKIKRRRREKPPLETHKADVGTLTLCRVTGKKERPTKFETTAKEGILVVWKRVKK